MSNKFLISVNILKFDFNIYKLFVLGWSHPYFYKKLNNDFDSYH